MHPGNYGYLNSAIHHPELMEEIDLIKQLVKSFNKGRAKILTHKDLILNFNKRKPQYINYKQSPFRKPVDASNMVKNLLRKINPYNKEGLKVISIRAFRSVHIREILTKWEKTNPNPSSLMKHLKK